MSRSAGNEYRLDTPPGGVLRLGTDALTFEPRWGLGQTRTIPLDQVSGVREFGERPPRIELSLRSGERVTIMVFPKLISFVWSDDATARDDALARVGQAIAMRGD